MKLPYSEPTPKGSARAMQAKEVRDLATEVSRLQPQALTRTNGEETDHSDRYPANFTKGLKHNKYGVLKDPEHYRCFVEAINSPSETLFEKHVPTAKDTAYNCRVGPSSGDEDNQTKWRGWESPRAGHVYDLEGPDAGAVGMAPAPRVGSSELAAEMAEVYALALLRDVSFTDICNGGGNQLCHKGGQAVLSAGEIVEELNSMSFFCRKKGKMVVTSSTPHQVDGTGLNAFERNRRYGRTLSLDGKLTTANVFRGSTKGAHAGPYISQFMLIGAESLAGAGSGPNFPGLDAGFGPEQGFIPYGSLVIDQRTLSHKACLDYMTDWCSWLDVQNGANFRGADQFEAKRRFITTPRDLATYVHYDALYEAYLNACLILLAMGTKTSKGFPEKSPTGHRDAFATFGGPHILSLVCEVATRCLKAVRRQKFNYHRRARPEALGGRLTLSKLGCGQELGCAASSFQKTLKEIPDNLLKAVIEHNRRQNCASVAEVRKMTCKGKGCLPPGVKTSKHFEDRNLLLPMAFPEGSPMHPAYGAGHATVAGGCVTMLKAFFEMFEDCDSFKERELPFCFVPEEDGNSLRKETKWQSALTIQGELDKLAANIAIGRNMAGVHYYSDYYDSLRMGERVAVGILLEQAPTYGETIEMTFTSFDGDHVTITGEAGSCPSLSVMDRNGAVLTPENWWLRHVSGAELVNDL
ncbi:vanadium-dependent haloperoxidase [Coralliovum pocilloporae]|uniref:vanadium-dependent haloperoxidase n=1 Tax=Coralliovum pocilloporae TaxID=3066369 RepID=UPI0033079D96